MTTDSTERNDMNNVVRMREVAVKASIAAAVEVLKYWPNPDNPLFDESLTLAILRKEGQGNFVTIADNKSESIIVDLIKKDPLLRGHAILGEEGTQIETDSEFTWVIDPIDGTPNFDAGNPRWGISIGILRHGQPFLGVIAVPGQGSIYVAQTGKEIQIMDLDGKYKREVANRMLQNPNVNFDYGLLAYDMGYEPRSPQYDGFIKKVAEGLGTYPTCLASVTASVIELINGGLKGYVIKYPTVYDIVAACVLISSAGGKVSSMDGGQIDFSRKESLTFVAAPTPQLHQRLLETLNK